MAIKGQKQDWLHGTEGRGKGALFLQSLIGTTDEKCIIWPMFIDPRTGYGRVGMRQFTGRASVGFAHRVMCELAHGPAPTPGHEVAHECDVRGCVNPKHLKWKTRSANQLDRRRNGTSVTTRTGSRGKLRPEQKHLIMSLKGKATIFELAEQYGVHYQTISRIQKHGFSTKGKLNFFFPEDDERLVTLWRSGVPRKEIAERMGRTMGSINGRLYKLRPARGAQS